MLRSLGQYVGRLLTYDSKDERTPSCDRNLRRRDLTAREELILERMQGTLLMNPDSQVALRVFRKGSILDFSYLAVRNYRTHANKDDDNIIHSLTTVG